jgi:hypothetical protein
MAGRFKMVKHYAPTGEPNFTELMKIPVSDRLPGLAEKLGVAELGKVLMAEITKFQLCYNVIRPMNLDQIAQCAFALIQTSEEDYLSLEDVIIFFEGAKQGKYGKIFDRLDQQIIFEMFELYRQQRHENLLRIKDEMSSQHKALPINDKLSDMFESEKDKMKSANIEYLRNKAQ